MYEDFGGNPFKNKNILNLSKNCGNFHFLCITFRFLNDTFGECGRPKAAWQIDPFGHSGEVGIEFAEMGFDGLFVGRIDHDDHKTRKRSKTMEMVWKPDPSLGKSC